MSAAVYNIKIDQGSDFFMTLTFKDALGVNVDLTGFTFAGKIRTYFNNATHVAEFDFDILDQVTDTGKVVVSLSAADSTAIPVVGFSSPNTSRPIQKFIYDIEATADGITQRWLQGLVQLSPEVTRV